MAKKISSVQASEADPKASLMCASRRQAKSKASSRLKNSTPLVSAAAAAFEDVINHVGFCIRLIIDVLSDLSFQLYLQNFKRRSLVLPAVTNALLEKSACELARMIRRRELSSEYLVRLCIARIEEIQPVLNCVVDERYKDALTEAQKVDRILSSLAPGTPLDELAREAPFLGVPLSTKEGIRTWGLTARRHWTAPADAEVIRLLRELGGAIPLCVTNVCESGLWWESANAIYGATNNPYDQTRSPGGSSGGEAALQAAAGIPLSIGSDTGGSIRTPSAFCGLFGHKPTAGAISVRGVGLTDPPPEFIPRLQVLGPMSRRSEDLVPILKLMLGGEEKANQMLKLDKPVPYTKMKYFYLDTQIGSPLLVSAPTAEVRQSMFRVVDFLEDNFGVVVRPLKMSKMRTKALSIFRTSLELDNTAGPSMQQTMTNLTGSPALLRCWLKWLIGRGDHILPVLVMATLEKIQDTGSWLAGRIPLLSHRNSQTLVEAQKEVVQFKKEISDILGENGVLLVPPHPTCAPYHFQSYMKPFNFVYTAVFNALGLPVTSVPLGLGQEGLPLGIQVVAGPFQDRLTLGLAAVLERPFGGWVPPYRDQDKGNYY